MSYGIYPNHVKESLVQKYLSCSNTNVKRFSEENGIPPSSFAYWLNNFKSGRLSGMRNKDIPQKKSAEEKFQLLMQYLTQSEEKQGVWLRENGLKEEHITLWQKELAGQLSAPKKKSEPSDKKKIKELEKEVQRKDKALAEITALLTLKKKVDLLFGEDEEA